MFSFARLSLFLATVSALNFPSQALLPRQESGICSTTNAQIILPDNQTMLVAPSEGPSYIALAIGVQNYTCASSGTWTNVGAVAELFDISCLYGTAQFAGLPQNAFALWSQLPPATTIQGIINILAPLHTPLVLGQHYFVPSPSGSGVSPKFDFTSASLAGHPDAFVIAAKAGDIPSPAGPPAIDWLELNNVQGNLAKQVFRIDTVNGSPPSSCQVGESPISVKYAAMYCECSCRKSG
ncbi:hypothetical protein FB45DRAFT_981623 [Roridomyces roridus]|uniref:Malate dehydrogenase n=1 Tax=Roridomyces roridus TaxID=1738132 RepID=A0AAD7BA65_9AGAR|nr:hypothetical protein FB45DRAFT_981623 [Roridomyces roridus]